MNDVQTKTRRVTITTEIEVSGAEPVQLAYRKSRIIPGVAMVTVIDGQWTRVEVTGPIVKNDGTASANSGTTTYWRNSSDADYPMPDWARDVAESCEQRA